jgi:pyruvate dehydrogenase E2 component (dihydrolipoamide acetyltransferase)
MATEVFLPRLTHDMRSGIFVGWLKAAGERVNPGEGLFEVETDKAVTEIAAEAGGIFAPGAVQPGEEIPIGAVVAYLLAEGEVVPDMQKPRQAGGPDGEPGKSPARAAGGDAEPVAPGIRASGKPPEAGERVVATPIARRMARELRIDLREVAGSGPGGRIIEADVRAVLSRRAGVQIQAGEPADDDVPSERVPLTRLQAVTGQRMALSSQTIPQFVLEVDVDMSEARRLRERWVTKKPPGYTAILVKAAAEALRAHPRVNACFEEGAVRVYQAINVGVAVATGEGLLVPVIHQADRLSQQEIQAALDRLRGQAREGKTPASALAGGTFTISNLGMYGVDRFQALVNPPQAAILAAGRIRDLPWVGPEGVEVRPVLTLRLSVDHRVLDGATAAPFLYEVKERLLAFRL